MYREVSDNLPSERRPMMSNYSFYCFQNRYHNMNSDVSLWELRHDLFRQFNHMVSHTVFWSNIVQLISVSTQHRSSDNLVTCRSKGARTQDPGSDHTRITVISQTCTRVRQAIEWGVTLVQHNLTHDTNRSKFRQNNRLTCSMTCS